MGKAAAAKNATRHGIFTATPVIPLVENEAQWQAHRLAIITSLDPVGGIEEALAERVALSLWRLHRVMRFESSTVGAQVETVESNDELPKNAEAAKEWAELLEAFPSLSPKHELSDDAAVTVLHFVDESIEPDRYRPTGAEWTVAHVWLAIEEAAKAQKTTKNLLIAEAQERANARQASDEAKAKSDVTTIARRRLLMLMYRERDTEKVMRYESHLERGLFKTLHQLERMKALRVGKDVTPPMVLDVTIDNDNQG